MPRYIDADAIHYVEIGKGVEIALASDIDKMPTVSPDDVRGVVHCKDCEWWTKQEASIQGRCARLAIYPTGEFYCASGSKAEPPKGVE